jgi:murein DD-endopeptidase MepM/ murein hydrolase activator NlpD
MARAAGRLGNSLSRYLGIRFSGSMPGGFFDGVSFPQSSHYGRWGSIMRSQIVRYGAIAIVQAVFCPTLLADEAAPQRYVLEYPAAEQFCPPIAGFFEEVVRTFDRVGSRTFRHQPNGGYGLPVVDKIGDAHLLHLGADVGWYRVGEPVFAVANGVVRVSEGPPPPQNEGKKERGRKAGGPMAWGSLVVLEHCLPNQRYATTIYGHLANDRLVKEGEVVRAGQQIGTIGNARVNGGYKPHLHFGVREGRMAEVGRLLVVVPLEETQVPLRIAEVREDAVVLSGADVLPEQLQLNVNGRTFEIRSHDGKGEVTPAILRAIDPPEFAIVGYGLTTKGWHDPIAFLKAHGAEIAPAPFEVAEGSRKRGRRAGEEETAGKPY